MDFVYFVISRIPNFTQTDLASVFTFGIIEIPPWKAGAAVDRQLDIVCGETRQRRIP